jgi:microcystin-dependent protein
MAKVTGRTVESIDALLDLMVVSVRIDTNGQLIWKNRKGEETNQGSIVSATLAVEAAWPVGSIFINTSSTNPNTLLGVGTWTRFAKGRTLVSLDEAQTEFDSPEEVGGAKTVVLTAAQSGMPYHSHSYSGSGSTGASSVNASVTTEDASSNPVGGATLDRAGGGGGDRTINSSGHAHSFSYGGTTSAAAANAAEAHTNLPPYVVVYMWKRTA